MKRDLLFFILTGINLWEDDAKLGEEVRMLYENIQDLCINRNEPVLEYISEQIEDNLSNYELGREIKSIYIPILIAYDRENPDRNNAKRFNLRRDNQ
jgi:hypothetical protein